MAGTTGETARMDSEPIPFGGASIEDRRSLRAIQEVLTHRGPLRYLEIGCYLGSTLQSFVTDPRCVSITAIDRRDSVSRDVRGSARYPHNTTAHMLELLARLPGAELSKIHPIDAGTDDLQPIDYEADLCFIDAEHTDDAVLRDARFCRKVIRDQGVIAFHDRLLVGQGIRRFLRELGRRPRVYPLKHDLLVVEIGVASLLDNPVVKAQVPRTAWLLADRLRLIRLALQLSSSIGSRRAGRGTSERLT